MADKFFKKEKKWQKTVPELSKFRRGIVGDIGGSKIVYYKKKGQFKKQRREDSQITYL